MNKVIEKEVEDTRFTKEQVLKSDKFYKYADVLSVILKGDKAYTLKEVKKEIEQFMKVKVLS